MSDKTEPSPREREYDEYIQPMVNSLAQVCKAHGMALSLAVEVEPELTATANTQDERVTLSTAMIRTCIKHAPDFDAFAAAMLTFHRHHKIDTSSSVVLRRLDSIPRN